MCVPVVSCLLSRIASFGVANAGIRAGSQQCLDQLGIAEIDRRCVHQRCEPEIILSVDWRACHAQRGDHFGRSAIAAQCNKLIPELSVIVADARLQ